VERWEGVGEGSTLIEAGGEIAIFWRGNQKKG